MNGSDQKSTVSAIFCIAFVVYLACSALDVFVDGADDDGERGGRLTTKLGTTRRCATLANIRWF
jgi:hypothetical protein